MYNCLKSKVFLYSSDKPRASRAQNQAETELVEACLSYAETPPRLLLN